MAIQAEFIHYNFMNSSNYRSLLQSLIGFHHKHLIASDLHHSQQAQLIHESYQAGNRVVAD